MEKLLGGLAQGLDLHNGRVGVEFSHSLAAIPLHPCLHPSVRCEVICERQDHPQSVLACLRHHIV